MVLQNSVKRLRYPFLLLLLLSGPLPGLADDHAADWLMRMSEAARRFDYDGVYVHVSDSHIDSLRIVHKIKPDGVHERLYALNGVPREVIRDPERVWCFLPDKSMGVLGNRPGKDSGFPGFMVKRIDQLEQNYVLTIGNTGRIADRRATRIRIMPRDELRYGYDLWADDETGLLLMSQMIDFEERPVEQFLFVLLDIGKDIPDAALEPMTPMSELTWHKDRQPARVTQIAESTWRLARLPDGFQVVKATRRWMPMEEGTVEHIVVSDGLSAVSVFAEAVEDDHFLPENLTSMGAVSAFTARRDGWLLTVIGEVPPATVKMIADGLERHEEGGS